MSSSLGGFAATLRFRRSQFNAITAGMPTVRRQLRKVSLGRCGTRNKKWPRPYSLTKYGDRHDTFAGFAAAYGPYGGYREDTPAECRRALRRIYEPAAQRLPCQCAARIR